MRGSRIRRLLIAVAVVAMVAAAPWAGAGTVTGKQPTGEVLKFGFIEARAESASVPQTRQALQAYFDDWNKRGGFRGQPVELVYDVVGFSPSEEQAAVLKQVNDDKVIAFLGIGVCQFTKPTLAPLKVASYWSGDPSCYDSSFMSAASGQATTLPMLLWAIDQGAKTFGVLYTDIPSLKTIFVDPLENYLKAHPDVKTKLVTKSLPLATTGADIDGAIAEFKAAGVDMLFASASPEGAALQLQRAKQQGFGPADGIRWIFGPNIYDPDVAANADDLQGTYVLSQWYPWEETKVPAVKKMVKTIGKQIEVRDGFAASGYQFGAILERALKTVKGPVTRASVLHALLSIHKFPMPIAPYKVDLADFANNPSGGQILKDENGKWTPVSDYIVTSSKEFAP
jgi:ABC-type branched-subunit amino acid transport system substrate-binding protein